MGLLMFFSMILLSGSFANAEEILPSPQVRGWAQGWFTAYDMDESEMADPAGYGDPEDDIGFKIRRARLSFSGVNKSFMYNISAGTSAPFDSMFQRGSVNLDLVDASLGVHLGKQLWIHTGIQKVPVSREQIMSSSQLVFTERAVSSVWLAPDREVGVLVDYLLKKGNSKIRSRAGVFNGNGSLLGDNNTGKMVAGRIDYVFGPANPYRTFGPEKRLTIGVSGDFFLNNDVATKVIGYGGDFILRANDLSILAEYRMSSLAPYNTDIDDPGVLAETSRMGFLAQVGYTVLNAYELAVRYSGFDDNQEIENTGDVAELMAGVTWHHPSDAIRVGGGYALRLENGPTAVQNDTARLWTQFKF